MLRTRMVTEACPAAMFDKVCTPQEPAGCLLFALSSSYRKVQIQQLTKLWSSAVSASGFPQLGNGLSGNQTQPAQVHGFAPKVAGFSVPTPALSVKDVLSRYCRSTLSGCFHSQQARMRCVSRP